MKIILLHGRDKPDQEMQDWGYHGPEILDVKYVHETYRTTLTVGFHSQEAAKKAAAQTGWSFWDDAVLEVEFTEDLIVAKGSYYGDWEFQED